MSARINTAYTEPKNIMDSLFGDFSDMNTLRTALGYTENKNPQPVLDFIGFCKSEYPKSSEITRAMLDEWLATKDFATKASHNFAITSIRRFMRYLNSINKKAFVPNSEYSVKVIKFAPYIFTDSELKGFFSAVDSLPPEYRSPNREYIVPVLFRMMYCCGMRPAEPLNLLCEDIDLDTRVVYIRKAKHRKDRRIVISSDLAELCKRYLAYNSPRKHFFEKANGEPYSTEWARRQFRFCWEQSGITHSRKPRPYDLRHNYATRTMLKWLNEGKDINEMATFLSTYMGHVEFSATLYYINLLPQMLQSTKGIDWDRFVGIYPDVSGGVV